MVGIPMFGDQHDNLVHMKAKGTAVEVDMQRMTSADLLNALKAVINNTSWVENIFLTKKHFVFEGIISFI